jgi:hypothetical protein
VKERERERILEIHRRHSDGAGCIKIDGTLDGHLTSSNPIKGKK